MTSLLHTSFLRLLLFTCASCLSCISTLVSSNEGTVTLTTHNLCPYGCFDEGSEIIFKADASFKGVATDVTRCAFKKINTPLDILVTPWERAQSMVRANQADGFFAASQKQSRDDFAVLSAIIADQKWQWFILKENPLEPTQPDFKKRATVGGFNGSNMLSWMEANDYQVRARPLDTEALLKMLMAKRVDAVMANNYVMEGLLKEYDVEDKVKIYTHKDKPLGIYFSKQFLASRPQFLSAFNEAVEACRADD